MPCLIPEILFAIGKKLVEDMNSNAIIRFTLSGKESLKAIKNVFVSVASLELYRDEYAIVWNNRSKIFRLRNGKPFCKFLMDQIGSRVETLYIDIDGINRMYQTVLDKIMAHPRLVTLTVGHRCSRLFLDKFLPAVSSSLKNVLVPDSIMHNVFRDTLNLDSLVVLESNGYDYLSFCCKTKSLELWHFHEDCFNIDYVPTFHDAIANIDSFSPHLSTVKKLTFNSTTHYFLPNDVFYGIKNHFPALEVFQYNKEFYNYDYQSPEGPIFDFIEYLLNIIEMDVAPPQKYACKFYTNQKVEFPSLEWCEDLFVSNEYYDETNQKFNDDEMKDFHCFRLNFPSNFDEYRTTIFEIHIAK